MKARGELAHAIRNPLAAADANVRFLRDLCGDLERAIRSIPEEQAPAAWRRLDPPRLLQEAREALSDSAKALAQINDRVTKWRDG